jgi:hypothetical protein
MRERAQQDEELGGLTVIGQVRLRQRDRLRWRLDKVGVQRRVSGQALALARAEQPRGEGHFQGVVLEKRVGGGFREEGGDARQPFFQRREFPPERYTEPSRCDEPPFAGDESFPSRRRPRQHCGQLGVHRGERLAQGWREVGTAAGTRASVVDQTRNEHFTSNIMFQNKYLSYHPFFRSVRKMSECFGQ